MKSPAHPLWPYSTRSTLLVSVTIWIVIFLAIAWLRTALAWTEMGSATVVLTVFALGLVPLALRLIDQLAGSRAVVDIKGVKLDFSQASAVRRGIELPDNVGRPEPVVADSSPMEIVSALEAATSHEVVRIDIRDGKAWWATRLLALAAGAVRAGAPRIIVFLGVQENAQGKFLGWARSSTVLSALSDDSRTHGPNVVTYGQVLAKAKWLAQQLAAYAEPDLPPPDAIYLPAPSPPLIAPPEIQRYLQHPDYRRLGEAALEQIIMDLAAQYQLEAAPDRLTLSRLNELFGPYLYHNCIELDGPQEEQITALLADAPDYVALVRAGRYEALARVDVIERQVLRQIISSI